MLTFLDFKELCVHFEFIPQGQIVNRECYKDVMQRLRKKISKKAPES